MSRRSFLMKFFLWILSILFGYKIGFEQSDDIAQRSKEKKISGNKEKELVETIQELTKNKSDILNVVEAFGADPTGKTDTTAQLTVAFASKKPLRFPKGTYKFSKTLVPDNNKDIIFEDGALLVADPKGDYSEMIQYPDTPLGLVVLFDTKYLGNPLVKANSYERGHNRFGTKISQLRLNGSNIANSVGIGPSIEFSGKEKDAREPFNYLEAPFVEKTDWGFYYPSGVVPHIGAGTGTIFNQPSTKTKNGMYLGANQDDIVVNSPRIYGSTGVGIEIKGHNKVLNAAFIRPKKGVGLQADAGTFGLTINGLFIEADQQNISNTSFPIKTNGSTLTDNPNSMVTLHINGLSINYPDGTKDQWRTWIYLNGRTDKVIIRNMSPKDWNKERYYTHVLEYGYNEGAGINGSSAIDYHGALYKGFIKHNYSVDENSFKEKALCQTKTEVSYSKGRGTFFGDWFIEDGEEPLYHQSVTSDTLLYLDACGLLGGMVTNKSSLPRKIDLHYTSRTAVKSKKRYYLTNSIDSKADLVVVFGQYSVPLQGANVLKPGQTAAFQFREADERFVQVSNV